MFDFTVKYLGFLKHIPLLPHVFEVMLKVKTFATNRLVLDYIDDIENIVLSWKGTSAHFHEFGGMQFNVSDKEIGHIHGHGLLDVPFSRSVKEQLIRESNGRVKEHHIFKKSGWISLPIKNELDKKLAIQILMRSYEDKSTRATNHKVRHEDLLFPAKATC